MGLLQNEDFKTEAELISAGGAKTQLLNDTKVYMSGLGQTLDDAVTMGLIGGGGATGLITGDDNIPKSTIGNWLAYADTAGISPIDMTGGSPVVTVTRNTTAPISDVADFLFTKPASNVQGNGFSLTKNSIPNKYKSRACMLRFKYFTSSTYVDNAVGLFLYDITGAVVYQLNPLYLKKSGLIESSFAEIQLPNTLTSGFRIGFHVIGTDSTAYTINFSEFTFDEKVTSQNSSITDPQSYTPTYGAGLGTVTTNKISYSKSGKYLLMDGVFLVGTPTTAEISLTLPTGLVASSDISSAYYSIVGSLTGEALVGADQQITIITIAGATKLYFGEQRSNQGLTPLTAGATYFYSGQRISFSARIPIQGWSAGTQISDIYTGRTVAADVYLSATQTGVNPNNTSVKINFNAVRNDTIGAFSTGAFRYNFLTSGWYDFSTTIYLLGSNVLANIYRLHIYKNGSLFFVGDQTTPTAGAPFNLTASTKRFFNAGDYLEVYLYGAGNNSVSTLSVYEDGTGAWSYFNINRIAGENQPLASEKVLLNYQDTSGTLVNSINQILTFDTKITDTRGMYTAGNIVSAKTGFLSLNSRVEYQALAYTTSQKINLSVFINGNIVAISPENWGNGVSHTLAASVHMRSYPVNVGDIITIRSTTDVNNNKSVTPYRNTVELEIV